MPSLSTSAAGRLCRAERPAWQLTTGLQRQDDVGTADIGDEVAGVLDRGLRKPLATLALISAYPFDAALQSSVVRRDTEFSRDDNDQAGAVAVTIFGVERLAVVPGHPLPIGEETGRGPTAIIELKGQQLSQRLFALLLGRDAVDPNGTPGQHGAMVQRLGRIVL